jgi:hypothetical protein
VQAPIVSGEGRQAKGSSQSVALFQSARQAWNGHEVQQPPATQRDQQQVSTHG